MWKLTLRNIVATRGRIALTVLAVVLGTGFISAAGTAGATLEASFVATVDPDDLADVVVSARADDVFAETPPLDGDAIARLSEVPGVIGVDPLVLAEATVGTADGEQLSDTGGGAIVVTYSVGVWPENATTPPPDLVAGEAPGGPGEVVVYDSLAEDGGLSVGDPVVVSSLATALDMRVVGLAELDEDSAFADGTPFVTYADAQTLAGRPGADSVQLAAADGVSDDELADRVTQEFGDAVVASTGADEIAALEAANADSTRITQGIIGGFGAIALVVGSFLVGNTINMIVAQRQRQLAMLRAIGATRRQVRRAVLAEAAVVTVASSILGALLGIAGGYGLVRLLASAGGETFPDVDLAVSPLFLAIAVVAGPLVGVLAARAAARRATTISPVSALAETGTADMAEREPRSRALVGLALLALAAAAFAVGIISDANQAAFAAIAGGVLALVALIVLNPVIARVAAPATHRLLPGSGGVAARMARRNTSRNPRRVAGTASALLVGLTVVVTAMVVAASVSATFTGAFERALTDTDVIVSQTAGVPETSLATVAELPEVGTAAATAFTDVAYDGRRITVSTVTRGIDEVLDVGASNGSTPGQLAPGEVAVSEGAVETFGLSIGDTVAVSFPDGSEDTWTVAGSYESETVLFGFTVTEESIAEAVRTPGYSNVLAALREGVDMSAGIAAVDAALADGQGTPQTVTEFNEAGQGSLEILLNIILGLLAVTLIIALLGVVNTTILSTLERTREFGMLRAVGTTRAQLRNAVRRETVAITLYGAMTGVVAGLVIGSLLVLSLESLDIDTLAIPWIRVAIVIVVAVIAGVLAAVLPARRAARMNVLEALHTV